jgi:SAM-dependent methyltransferase
MALAPPFCPRCLISVHGVDKCPQCGLTFELHGAVVDTIRGGDRGKPAGEVEDFYSVNPFPGYAPGDTRGTLLDRSRRSHFLTSLDAAIPTNARVLECGCGTAQLSAFLATSGPGRTVIGVDGCRVSLKCGDEFRERVGLTNLQLVRGDLFDLPVEESAYQVVISRGVVHHTPDPDEATRQVARRVAPGGVLVLGFYETWGRAVHCARRGLTRFRHAPVRALDPILRKTDLDEEKKRIWIEDQYRHPLERILPMPHVLKVLESEGFSWIRSIPPAATDGGMFDKTPKPGAFGRSLLRAGWMARGFTDPDAGLVSLVARRLG